MLEAFTLMGYMITSLEDFFRNIDQESI